MNLQQLQQWVDGIQANASVYAFDILPDGSFSEIRMAAVNAGFATMFALNPNAPPFRPGIPYHYYFKDVNFERFCYKSASNREALHSYVNAFGAWLTGLYFPVDGDPCEQPDGQKTVYCCYILKVANQMDSDVMSERSGNIAAAVLDVSVKLHKAQEFYCSISEAVSEISKICDAERCSVVIVNKKTQEFTFVNESGIHDDFMKKLANEMGRTPYETALAWEKDLAGTDCFLLDDLSIIRERDLPWYESMCAHKIKSIVLYAIRFNNELVGFIWAANFNAEKMLQIKETLELTSFFLGAVIANHQLLGQLEYLSMVDMLTQVHNRNAMNKRVDSLVAGITPKPERMGVVFADLNGLKTVNDDEGHDAGDRLLSRAAALLKTAFGKYEIYRSGGDEFVVLCPNITADELCQLTHELENLSHTTEDVRFAVGTGCFEGDYDICRAMQIADERMYRDKEEYYRRHPEKNRRKN